jgi:hypothetical protein
VSEQRVAIGFRGRRNLCTDLAGCARLGLDHDRLLEQRLDRGGERPSDHVDSATWWERVDDRNRVRRVSVLRKARANGERCGCGGATGDKMASVHVIPPLDIGFLTGGWPALLLWQGCYRPPWWAIKRQ